MAGMSMPLGRPTLSRVPIAPCPECGATAWHRPDYAPVGRWYCGNCGAEYVPLLRVGARAHTGEDARHD